MLAWVLRTPLPTKPVCPESGLGLSAPGPGVGDSREALPGHCERSVCHRQGRGCLYDPSSPDAVFTDESFDPELVVPCSGHSLSRWTPRECLAPCAVPESLMEQVRIYRSSLTMAIDCPEVSI